MTTAEKMTYKEAIAEIKELIVRMKNAFRKKETSMDFTMTFDELSKALDGINASFRKNDKAICESHDYCEECNLYTTEGCVYADDVKGIPCYWEVDE